MKLKLSPTVIRELFELDPLELPTNVSPLINLANTFSGGTKPAVVGKMTELIKEFGDGDLEKWELWYKDRFTDSLEKAREKIKTRLSDFRKALDKITDAQIDEWVRDLVIVKTYIGLRIQEAILQFVANHLNLKYIEATSQDESKNIDGCIGNTPVSVKPDSYRMKPEIRGTLPDVIIYYSKGEKGVYTIEFDESKIK